MKHRREQYKMTTEYKTLSAMVNIYCQGQHKSKNSLCEECKQVVNYARDRLDRCAFGANKTNCKSCTVHCYKPTMREKIRSIMRYSGPRMLFRHPVLVLFHALDSVRKTKHVKIKPL